MVFNTFVLILKKREKFRGNLEVKNTHDTVYGVSGTQTVTTLLFLLMKNLGVDYPFRYVF